MTPKHIVIVGYDDMLMTRPHEMLELIPASRAGLQAKEQRSPISPLQGSVEFHYGQELHCVYTKLHELVQVRYCIGERSSRSRGESEGTDVQFIDHKVLEIRQWLLQRLRFLGSAGKG